MKLIRFEKVRDGKYLKNYALTYHNKSGKEKVYVRYALVCVRFGGYLDVYESSFLRYPTIRKSQL